VHEEDNLKEVLSDTTDAPPRTKAREIGVNRYDRIRGFDFSAADAYWRTTGPLWAVVRQAWAERLARADTWRIVTTCEGEQVFLRLFEYASTLEEGETPSPSAMKAFVGQLLDCVVEPG
jgi:hypothetical protein